MGAFQVLTTEYDRTDAPRVRNYADAYYLKNTALITGGISTPLHAQLARLPFHAHGLRRGATATPSPRTRAGA